MQGWKEDLEPKLMFPRWNRQSSAIAHVKSLFTSQDEQISTTFGFLWRQKSEYNIFDNLDLPCATNDGKTDARIP